MTGMGDVTPCCGLLMVYKHTWFIMNNKLSLRGSDDSGLCRSYATVQARVTDVGIVYNKFMLGRASAGMGVPRITVRV